MERLSCERVVDELVNALAEKRRSRLERNSAYVALARAILADDIAELGDAADIAA
jgi:hypothetical protein